MRGFISAGKVRSTMVSDLSRAPITVVIPTLNEELNIEACLSSVQGWVETILVVDSGSSDRTVELAEAYGARVVTHPYVSAPQQWAWILQEGPVHTPWILALDADQRVDPKLKAAIFREFRSQANQPSGYYIRHRQMFMNRFIRHGGMYPRSRLILFKRDSVTTDDRDLVDHRFYLSGPSRSLEFDVIESNEKEQDLSFWIKKQLAYAERAAEEELARAAEQSSYGRASLWGGRNERVLWLKRKWANLPLYWRSVGYFMYRYVLRGGFLDGREGFLYHFTQGLLFRIVLDRRVEDLRRGHRTRTRSIKDI